MQRGLGFGARPTQYGILNSSPCCRIKLVTTGRISPNAAINTQGGAIPTPALDKRRTAIARTQLTILNELAVEASANWRWKAAESPLIANPL